MAQKKAQSTKRQTAEAKTAAAAEKKPAAADKAEPAAKKAAPTPVAEEPKPVAEESVQPKEEVAMEPHYDSPRRSVAFIGSECHPFVKTGGLGDVMYALPRELVKQNCNVRVILPRYACIPQKYQDKMVYRGEFYMDLGKTGRNYYVGIMEYICDGVVYDFIDNQEFFSSGNPYISLVDDIPKYCFFSKAALAALNFLNWIPDVIHCHDWQAALVPVYLHTMFQDSPVGRAKTVLTIHNLRFQGIYNIPTIRYWTGLPDSVFNMGALKQGYEDANMLKGGLAYADRITTVSGTYAQEIQTAEYGEKLENHLRYHVIELPITGDYRYGSINRSTARSYSFTYNYANKNTLQCVNIGTSWAAKLTKIEENKPEIKLQDAYFALYSPVEADQMTKDACSALLVTKKPDLTYEDENGTKWYLKSVVKTDANGTLTWAGLSESEYRYVEVQAPNGYNLDSTVRKVTRPTGGGTASVSVTNRPGYNLPETGGIGTWPFMTAGLLLTGTALALLLKKRKTNN